MMVNAHKQRGEKLSGNTGCCVLLSGVLCVSFYTEILPFISSLVNSHSQWCIIQSGLIEIGFLRWVVSQSRHF